MSEESRAVATAGRKPTRRALLATLGAGGTAGLAGCGLLTDGDDGTTDRRPTPAGTTTSDNTTSTTGTATETPTTADGHPSTWAEGGPPDRAGWTVTFQDDFAGEELDWETWEVGFGPYSTKDCAAAACARRENISVEDGRLVLETTPEGADEIPNSTWLADYTTGAVCTAGSFQQTFGYFEAKARLPAQPGALAAFWAWSEDGNPPEIDFYESFGATPNRLTTTIHVDCNGDGETQGRGTRFDVAERLDDTFHVVGCAWGPDAVTWYLDGREVHHVEGVWIEDCHDPEPLFPILNTHVGGREDDFIGPDAVGDPTAADYPYTHEVEWIRVWQRDAWEAEAAPRSGIAAPRTTGP